MKTLEQSYENVCANCKSLCKSTCIKHNIFIMCIEKNKCKCENWEGKA
jgi:hypothetical protein